MLITLSRRTAICQSFADVKLTGVAPLRAVSYKFILILISILLYVISFLLLKKNLMDCRKGSLQKALVFSNYVCSLCFITVHFSQYYSRAVC